MCLLPNLRTCERIGKQRKTDQKGRFEFLAALLGFEPGFSP